MTVMDAASGTAAATTQSFDVYSVRRDFPILTQRVHGKPLVYLDNANTTQKPSTVIEAMDRYYREYNSNIHRATHTLSEKATRAYESVRTTVQRFLNAPSSDEIIFVRTATEGINLVAQTWGRRNVGPDDEIIVSAMEHHANIVPWQMLCEEKGAHLRVIPMNEHGELLLEAYEKMFSPKTRIVAITQMSNVLGTVNPVGDMITTAHRQGVPVLVDGAQSAYHLPVDVQQLDCDFFVFSGHKLYGPTGIGVLYGKAALLEAMPPWQGGGDMIRTVSFEKTIYADIPYKFEAGTPNIAGTIGLGAAIEYIESLGMCRIAEHEADLLRYGSEALDQVPGLRMIGTAKHKASVFSFVLDDVHPHDIGTILDQEGVAIRTGQHCAHPVMEWFCLPATARASLACYNTREEIDALVRALGRVAEVFG